MNIPIGENYFRAYRVVWQNFANIGPGTSKNRWTEKKEETRVKYKSLPLSLERYAGDCKYCDLLPQS